MVCRFQGQVISKLGGFKVERSCGNFGVRRCGLKASFSKIELEFKFLALLSAQTELQLL